MKIDAQIGRRFAKYEVAVLETFALLLADRISIGEARRRNRAVDQEMRAIRKLVMKERQRRQQRKIHRPTTKEPEQAPATKRPNMRWMGRKEEGGSTTYRIG
jgi:hypothetical protein